MTFPFFSRLPSRKCLCQTMPAKHRGQPASRLGRANRRLEFETLEDRVVLNATSLPSATLLKDIGSKVWIDNSGYPFVQAGAYAYFSATVAGTEELFRTNGTAAGTVPIGGVHGTACDPFYLTAVGSTLYIGGYLATGQDPLWMYNGVKLKQIGIFNNLEDDLTAVGANLYFTAADSAGNSELWQYDGKGVTQITTAANAMPYQLTAVGSTLYFAAGGATATDQLWKYDGGTLTEITVGTFSNPNPFDLTAVGNTLYFEADVGTAPPSAGYLDGQLWKYDGATLTEITVGNYANP